MKFQPSASKRNTNLVKTKYPYSTAVDQTRQAAQPHLDEPLHADSAYCGKGFPDIQSREDVPHIRLRGLFIVMHWARIYR